MSSTVCLQAYLNCIPHSLVESWHVACISHSLSCGQNGIRTKKKMEWKLVLSVLPWTC